MTPDVPSRVREFLALRIDTFEKLEAIVALDASPQATMTVDQLVNVLKAPRDIVRQTIVELRAVLLVDFTSRGAVQLLPLSQTDQAIVKEVLDAYANDRLTIVRLLGEIAMDRIRNMASRAFADAFVLRKRPKGDDEDG